MARPTPRRDRRGRGGLQRPFSPRCSGASPSRGSITPVERGQSPRFVLELAPRGAWEWSRRVEHERTVAVREDLRPAGRPDLSAIPQLDPKALAGPSGYLFLATHEQGRLTEGGAMPEM